VKRRTFRAQHSSSGPGVFTWIVRVKVKLFTVNFLSAAKLFTVSCGEWFLRLSLPPMNNFGGTIRAQRTQRCFHSALRALRDLLFTNPFNESVEMRWQESRPAEADNMDVGPATETDLQSDLIEAPGNPF